MKKLIRYSIASMILLALNTSCERDEIQMANERNITINNDEVALNARMTILNEPVSIIGTNGGRLANSATLTLKGSLAPPVVDGNVLQATSIARRTSFFAVGYNFRGEVYSGGIDLINDELTLKSQILFGDADVNDLTFNGNNLYFVGGTSSLSEPAFIERIGINPSVGVFTLQNQTRTSVGSYVANSVLNYKSNIYVTSGNDDRNGGGLYKMTRQLEQEQYIRIKDARWATGWENTVFCASGNPDKIRVYDITDLNKTSEFQHNGRNEEEGKMTIDVDRNLVFIAGGEEGILVYDLDGNFIAKHTFGNGSITNAVSANRGKVFISNGEGGVYIATYDPFLEVVGKLDLDTEESVNHIVFHEDILYVASGIGGVKMIQVE